MAKQKYKLNPNEKIVYKASCVRHGFWGMYTNILIVTNEAVILEKRSTFDFYKGIERYNYSDIKQVLIGEASNGEKQLEIYIGDKKEDFALQSGDDSELQIIYTAINDQMGPDAKYYDSSFYQDLVKHSKESDKLMELELKAAKEDNNNSSNKSFISDAAKSIVKTKSISKGLVKAANKRNRNRVMNEILDDIGAHDVQDMFTEFGNDIRETFGLKTKMTHAERKELQELREKKIKRDYETEKREAIKNKIDNKKKSIDDTKEEKDTKKEETRSIKDVNEQFDALKKAKELLDLGVLTEEEFQEMKKEIMNK